MFVVPACVGVLRMRRNTVLLFLKLSLQKFQKQLSIGPSLDNLEEFISVLTRNWVLYTISDCDILHSSFQ